MKQKQSIKRIGGSSIALLVIMLVVALADQDMPHWVVQAITPIGLFYWYGTIGFILTAAIVWLNRENLAIINIDKPFVLILIFSGLMRFAFYLPFTIGILAILVSGFIFWGFRNDKFVLEGAKPYSWQMGIFVLLALVPVAPAFLLKFPSFNPAVNIQSIVAAAFAANLPAVAFEEFLFRGLLWGVLRERGLSERNTLFVQALLFWFMHRRYLTEHDYYSFWFSVPFAALLYGIIVWRSKSLSMSTAAHFLFNFATSLVG